MKKIAICLLLLVVLLSCKKEGIDKYSSLEKETILDTLKSRMKADVDDFTILEKRPTNILFLNSAFLLDSATVAMYEKDGWVKNKQDDLEDFVEVNVIKYDLKKEDGKAIEIRDNNLIEVGNSPYFEENEKLYSNFSIDIPLNEKYTELNGNITIELRIDNQNKREFSIPVKIKLKDFFN